MIYSDQLSQYLLYQLRRRQHDMHPIVPFDFPKDPLNRHYDDRRPWLAWHDEPEAKTPLRHRAGRALVRIGTAVAGIPATQADKAAPSH